MTFHDVPLQCFFTAAPVLIKEVNAMRVLKVILTLAGAAIAVAGISAVIAVQMLSEWMRDKLNI